MNSVLVCSENDLPTGSKKVVNFQETPVVVLNVNGSYYAIEAVCPHQRGPLSQGVILPKLEASFVGAGKRLDESFSETSFTISCPWHGWEFDLSTGHHCGDSEVSLKVFNIVVESGNIYLKEK